MGQAYWMGSLLPESLDVSRLSRTDGFSSKSRLPYFQHESSRTRICQQAKSFVGAPFLAKSLHGSTTLAKITV
jgi:hypothetical protein